MSHRRGRAVFVIGLSLATLAVTAVGYLGPPPATDSSAAAAPVFAMTAPGESATFAFLTPSIGWAAASIAGEHKLWIYATKDGARTWEAIGVVPNLVNLSPVSTLEFFDRAHGVLVIEPDELVYLTDDGGRGWAPVALPRDIVYVTFINPLVAWATTGFNGSGAMKLFVTNDAGTTWQRLPNLPVSGYPVFRSLTEGWVAGPSGTHIVYTSSDAGVSWQPHSLPTSPCAVASLGCGFTTGSLGSVELLPGTGAVATDSQTGAAFVSFDFGATWRFVVPPPTSPIDYSKESFEDALHWWAIGAKHLYKTADAGATWSLVSDRIRYDSLQPNILDPQHAWVELQANDTSRLEMTSDGGVNWKDVMVPVPF